MKQNTPDLPDSAALRRLEDALGYHFRNMQLLHLALTHSSWANERGVGQRHNERLEFLGDAVLELTVSKELFERFHDLREGELTRLRSRLVSTASLAERARELGIRELLLLGRGEEQQGGRQRDTVLSDAFEAVLAAVYEDGGFAAAQQCVGRIFAGLWPCGQHAPAHKDYKTRLQEVTQQRYRQRPVYRLVNSRGPEQAKVFDVAVMLPDGREIAASGASCKKAEQEAARLALLACKVPDETAPQ